MISCLFSAPSLKGLQSSVNFKRSTNEFPIEDLSNNNRLSAPLTH